MFPKRERFTHTTLPVAMKKGRRLSSPHFMLTIPTTKDSYIKKAYAVVISKKVVRLSVARHRAKRRITAALRSLPLPAQLIVTLRAPIDSVSYQDVREELIHLIAPYRH